MTLTLAHYLILGAIMFALGVFGVFLNRRNLISLLNFVAFSMWNPGANGLPETSGQIFVFFILTVAAAEAAIGLAILVLLFRRINSINVDDVGRLKG